MKKLGLTGGIACGKSTVSTMLKTLGWEIIDADKIVDVLYEPGQPGYKKVIDTFGDDVLNSDRTVNRALLGRLVFSDPEQRRLLNSLIHPLVREVWQKQIKQLQQGSSPVLTVIPLLFEVGLENDFDSVGCVACSGSVQRERLKRQGRELIEERIRAQWPLEEKMNRSQVLLWNDGSLEQLKTQAHALDALWRG